MKKYFVLLILLIFPSYILRWLLPLIGIQFGRNSKIGFSIVVAGSIKILDHCQIGHFNFIHIESLSMMRSSYIRHFNLIRGPFKLILNEKSAIGKNCIISRGANGITYGASKLELGVLSKITANHFLDLTRSVIIGDYSTLAGIRSQLWTHGYVHAPNGADRFRVDGELKIGNNVYIGSGVIINPGVEIVDGVSLGGNSCVSKSLLQKGMYVSQPLRYIERDYDAIKASLKEISEPDLIEKVFEKDPK
jgi:acetyltransferase-like isoleucine patch superfamily enzyme